MLAGWVRRATKALEAMVTIQDRGRGQQRVWDGRDGRDGGEGGGTEGRRAAGSRRARGVGAGARAGAGEGVTAASVRAGVGGGVPVTKENKPAKVLKQRREGEERRRGDGAAGGREGERGCRGERRRWQRCTKPPEMMLKRA